MLATHQAVIDKRRLLERKGGAGFRGVLVFFPVAHRAIGNRNRSCQPFLLLICEKPDGSQAIQVLLVAHVLFDQDAPEKDEPPNL